jgi:hypothetical protein
VKSGHVTDTFTQFGIDLPFGSSYHFKVKDDGHGGTKVTFAPLFTSAKPANHHDSFAFNTEVARGTESPTSDSGPHVNHQIANTGAEDSFHLGSLDVSPHPLIESADLWHHLVS